MTRILAIAEHVISDTDKPCGADDLFEFGSHGNHFQGDVCPGEEATREDSPTPLSQELCPSSESLP